MGNKNINVFYLSDSRWDNICYTFMSYNVKLSLIFFLVIVPLYNLTSYIWNNELWCIENEVSHLTFFNEEINYGYSQPENKEMLIFSLI